MLRLLTIGHQLGWDDGWLVRPHANSCLTCPIFVTTAEFLPQHHATGQQTLQMVSAAEATGRARVAEMNLQVAANLDKIVSALEADGDEEERRKPPVRPDPLTESPARRHELTRPCGN
jgi:hypothetical protein